MSVKTPQKGKSEDNIPQGIPRGRRAEKEEIMKKWLQRGLGFLLVCLLLIQGGSYSAQAQPAVVAHGLDVSQWQGDIDWARVAGEGISFVMFGLGRYQQPDPRFEENISEATAQGIQAGAYLRSQASTVEMARE